MIYYPAETGRLPQGNFAVQKIIRIFTYMKAIYLTDLAQQYFPKSSTRSAVAQLRQLDSAERRLTATAYGTAFP